MIRLVFLLPILLPLCATGQSVTKSIRDLDMLIGKWKTKEVYMGGTSSEIIDYGERTCQYILNDTYINCETVSSTSKGLQRKYQFLINYNKLSDQYEMMSIYSNWPLKRMDVIKIYDNGKVLEIIGNPETENSIVKRIWGTLTFTDNKNYVWRGKKNTSQQKPDEWMNLFEEVGERVE